MPAIRVCLKFIGVSALLGLAACSNEPLVKKPTPVKDAEAKAATFSDYEYVINPGDNLDIKLFYTPDLNEEVTVRPDGRISLQLVGEIFAAGRTPAELGAILTEQYGREIRKPEVTVIVRSFSAQKIYVDGEVGKPTLLDLESKTTVLQSIAAAGGLLDTARLNEVIVIRRGPESEPMVIPVDLEKALDGTDMNQDLVLMPYDLVYVPKSPIGNVNVWVDQYISGVLPSELLTIWLINKN
jgi:protein involved in polysaccharide export with SLBB domain